MGLPCIQQARKGYWPGGAIYKCKKLKTKKKTFFYKEIVKL